MQFLALQTNVHKLEETFVAEGEELLISTHHHFFVFLFPMILKTFVALLVIGLVVTYVTAVPNAGTLTAGGWLVILCLWLYAYGFFASYVEWRYNFLIVTTMKVVIIEQHSVFRHVVLPIHLDTISSVSFGLKFLGIGRCGTLNIHLTERLGGSTRNIILQYMPSPDAVTGIIENASALIMQKQQEGEKKEDQQQKIENVQQKAEEVKGAVGPSPASE